MMFKNEVERIRYTIGKAYVEGTFENEENDFVREAFEEISKVNRELFELIPFPVIFVDEDPYQSAKEMRERVLKEKVIYIFTVFGGHPYLDQEANNMGRAVHDVYAHLVCGCPFNFEGEYNAYLEQRNYYPDWTWKVLFAEIPAQTSAFYYQGIIGDKSSPFYTGVGNFDYTQRAIEAPQEWLDLCEPLKRSYEGGILDPFTLALKPGTVITQ